MIVFRCAKCREQLDVPSSLAGSTIACPTCGNINHVPAHAHPTYAQVAVSAAAVPACSRTVYILLGLFLGGLGIHNFVAGYTTRGLAQLLITILLFWLIIPLIAVAIWVIIDICTVTHDAKGVRMG